MLNIKLGEDYVIKSDSLNYILYKRHLSDPTHRFSKGEAKESWDVLGYFSKLEHLVNYVIERELKDCQAESLRDLSQLIRLVGKMMVQKLEELADVED